MRSLCYILLTTMKNYLNDMKNHPGRMIAIILLIAMLAISVFTSANVSISAEYYRDAGELYAIIFLFYLFTFIVTAKAGFDSGASLYSMADVNFVFTSPVSNVSILTYGLLRQAGMSLIIGFFLLFQYSWLHNMYGLSMAQMIAILAGYGILIFSSQLTAMTIYSFLSNSQRRKKTLALCICAAGAVYLLYAAYTVYLRGPSMEAAIACLNSGIFSSIPVAGWTMAAVRWAMGGSALSGTAGILADLAYVVLFIVMVVKMRPDFYEDVLTATEVSANAVAAKKQGETTDVPKHVRKGRTGINRGWGPTVFFYKHLLEGRRSGLMLLDRTSMINIAVAAIIAIIMGHSANIYYIFGIAAYMQLLFAMTASGRWTKELRMPYVFLVPASPFVKLFMIIWDNIFRLIIESIVMFAVLSLLTEATAVQLISCAAARIALGMLFMAGNIFIVRVMGTSGGQVLPRFAFLGAMIVSMLPVATVGVIIAPFLPLGDTTVSIMTGMTLSALILSAIIVACCRNMLNCAELANK